MANIIIIPWNAPSQSKPKFLVLKASCGLMTSKDVSTCVTTEEDKFAPILSAVRAEERRLVGGGVLESKGHVRE